MMDRDKARELSGYNGMSTDETLRYAAKLKKLDKKDKSYMEHECEECVHALPLRAAGFRRLFQNWISNLHSHGEPEFWPTRWCDMMCLFVWKDMMSMPCFREKKRGA